MQSFSLTFLFNAVKVFRGFKETFKLRLLEEFKNVQIKNSAQNRNIKGKKAYEDISSAILKKKLQLHVFIFAPTISKEQKKGFRNNVMSLNVRF